MIGFLLGAVLVCGYLMLIVGMVYTAYYLAFRYEYRGTFEVFLAAALAVVALVFVLGPLAVIVGDIGPRPE